MQEAVPSPVPHRRLGRVARHRFAEGLCAALPALDRKLLDFLVELTGLTATQREMQSRRDALTRYQQHHLKWIEGVARAWRSSLAPLVTTSRGALSSATDSFELVSDDVVENKILASRIALTVAEHAGTNYDALRQRTQQLEGQELESHDILRPEVLCLALVDQWVHAGLPRTDLQLPLDPLQRELAALVQAQYQEAAAFLEAQGVQASNDLRSRVRRTAGGSLVGGGGAGAADSANAGVNAASTSSAGGLATQALRASREALAGGAGLRSGLTQPGPVTGAPSGLFVTPLVRARQRAQGVMGQLRRLLVQPAPGVDLSQPGQLMHPGQPGVPGQPAPPASAALVQALAAQRMQADSYYGGATLVEDYSPVAVVQLVGAVRERSAELKKKATTAGEKAIIEVVALMFQSILSEDRIPPSVRVWFARLQVPVLRVALAEPEFFSNLTHPARQLIDRMGAVVLGFDAAAISGSAMEGEIRRVVQVIEQYPETGQRVFQLVYDEFEKFLSKFLTEKQTTSRLVTVAQQVEQRETLAIQYTIELRALLKDMPVRDEIREFLFKTWAEVLALSAVRDGPQHADTTVFKQTAADLVWAASAKPNRADRAKVIQTLPALLQRVRQGLALVGTSGEAQDAQVKVLTDTLADAFLSKTASIPQAHIDTLARRLANLEDYLSDATLGEMPLNADNIEMLLGIDASSIHVVADNGAPVQAEMVAWAQELPVGNWYTLDHNGASAQVQYVWHSARKQLHLFAATDGSSYLLQLHRLGAYLQAGLLVGQDDEGLTTRATRDALAKLDANPERLLG
ncbi:MULTISPECIES: DUF1631 family protein [unclassified Acidovorax]|uniref:DUF1631 family protein n=1 Tax=unclassified Acidovorax TaxID=2684926 RepID=UPI00288337AF|nr:MULTISPECIES: DUF1631 family protein [unclassified Acidovorax]